jgi:hypothetical protein
VIDAVFRCAALPTYGLASCDCHCEKPPIDRQPRLKHSSRVMTASSELDLKQRLAKLSERERRDMSAYLLRLKHQSKSGRAGVSKLMKDMDAGKKTKLSQLVGD